MRLFVGVRVSVQTANALALAVETMARRANEQKIDLKFVPPANYHVTLRFLGNTRPEILPALTDKLGEAMAGIAPFSFRTSRVIEKPGMLWAGIEDSKALTEVAARVEAVAVDLGFAAEKRPFSAHVTIARTRESRPLRDIVLPVSEQMFSESRVEGITVIESETNPKGSVYSDRAKIAFKKAENAGENAVRRQTGPVDMADTDDGWPRGQGPTDQ